MTVEEFLALPEDGISRELIRGEVRERGMMIRNRAHMRVEIRMGQLLGNWLDEQLEPRGEFHGSEIGFRLHGTRESLVGIEIAYASPELLASTRDEENIYNGPPALAIEILSPSDTHQDVVEKLRLYRDAGVVVWIVDPDLCTVDVYQPEYEGKAYNASDELSGEPYLPGFRCFVSKFFSRQEARPT